MSNDNSNGVDFGKYLAMQALQERFVLIPRSMDDQEGISNGLYDETEYAQTVLRPLVEALAEACIARDIPFVLNMQTAVIPQGSINVSACHINPHQRYLGTVLKQYAILKNNNDENDAGHDIP